MEPHLKIVGILLVALAFSHLTFPKYLNWKQELGSLSILNRQMMYVHSFFVAFGVFLMGVLCMTSADELINTTLGRRVSLGLGIFWTVRLIVQFFGYSPKVWKGKPFETTVHVLFSLFWSYLSAVFILTYMNV